MVAAIVAVVLAIVTLIAGVLSPSDPDGPPPRAGGPLIGVHEPNSWRVGYPSVTPDQVASLISEMNAESHRWPLSWQDVEPAEPVGATHEYDFSVYDRMYQADLAHGVRPLIIVINAPAWTWAGDIPQLGQGFGYPPAPSHYSDWAQFCAEVARRYPEAAGIEVWNEPNHPAFWGRGLPQSAPDPGEYSDLLHVASEAIKEIDPGMVVLGGSLAPFGPGASGGRIPLTDFLREMLERGAADDIDAISMHTYASSPSREGPSLFTWAIDLARSAENSVGEQLPLWLTEVGITTTGPTAATPAKQAAALTSMVGWARAQPDVDALFFHTLTEPTADEQDAEKGYAFLTGTAYPFGEKPAFDALRRVIAGGADSVEPSAPKLDLSVRAKVKRVHGSRRILLAASCGDVGCRVKATGRLLLAGSGRRGLSLRPDKAVVAAGDTTGLRLDPRRGAERALVASLRQRRKVRARVSVSARGQDGSSDARSLSIRIR